MISRIRNPKHGHARIGKRHPLFNLWGLMKGRCNNPNYVFAHRYSGRGISVCPEWANDYKTFYRWAIENGWQEGLDLDRKDNDGNYEPGNCRFVPHVVNVQNSTVAKLNATQVLAIRNRHADGGIYFKVLAAEFGVSIATIGHIVSRKTWKNL
jgi:hypothetical protein